MTVDPFTIVFDSREQMPLHFSAGIEVVRDCLPAGDYSILGYETEFAIERKSLSDLCGTLTEGRDRFKRELAKLAEYRFAAIVIEGSWTQILMGEYRSQLNPNSIIGSLMSFAIKYGVVPILADDHFLSGQLVENLCHNYLRILDQEKRQASVIEIGLVAPLMDRFHQELSRIDPSINHQPLNPSLKPERMKKNA